MREFCDLYWRLDSTTKTLEKVKALKEYFAAAEPEDAIWAIYFLVGQRLKRLVGTKLLRQWAVDRAGISAWLFEECYDRVGDLAETISLVLPPAVQSEEVSLKQLIEGELIPLRECEEQEQRRRVLDLWSRFNSKSIFVLGKLMTGGFRVGVSKRLVIRALAEHSDIEAATITHRLMGDWSPDATFYEALLDPNESETAISKPYPFFLANPLKNESDQSPDLLLGSTELWTAEWKWDGVRAQVIRRSGETFIWSRGEELVTLQFPEVANAAEQLPDGTVLDGEILGWSAEQNRPLEFSQLQRRLGRKKVGKKLLGEVPVVMLAFDVIEFESQDIRTTPLEQRQEILKGLLQTLSPVESPTESTGGLFAKEKVESIEQHAAIRIPPQIKRPKSKQTWKYLQSQRAAAKQFRAEGLMLKRKDSTYQVNRPVGDWWKWKVDPYTIDAVLIYAQRGHGRRASLYSDYTFAVWKDEQLVPFAKAYSGLTDAEIRKVDAFVRKNTNEKFGPVRSVTPELVFELAFENIQKSTRHKSGIAVRFPRISRWRHDKKPADADHLATILQMLDLEV